MKNLPFNSYDYFGYIASGFVLLFAVDRILLKSTVITADQSMPLLLFLLIGCYALGHIVSGASSTIFEQTIAKHLLGEPTEILLRESESNKITRLVFKTYTTPFPEQLVKTINSAFPQSIQNGSTADRFWEAFREGRKNEPLQIRLETFLNLYGFSRNLTFVLLVITLLLVADRYIGTATASVGWPIVTGICTVLMFYRYLKFFRMYAAELLIEYPGNVREGANR